MALSSGEAIRWPVFALVAYISGPLGSFLNRLRAELVPSYHLFSHLTLLPPRPVKAPERAILKHLEARISQTPVFDVELGDVEIFPVTSVIYLSVLVGRGPVESIHDHLNQRLLAFDEPFEFQPHVTLAQEVEPENLLAAYAMARQRWERWRGPRTFTVEKLTLVRNGGPDVWTTLSEYQLGCANLLKTV